MSIDAWTLAWRFARFRCLGRVCRGESRRYRPGETLADCGGLWQRLKATRCCGYHPPAHWCRSSPPHRETYLNLISLRIDGSRQVLDDPADGGATRLGCAQDMKDAPRSHSHDPRKAMRSSQRDRATRGDSACNPVANISRATDARITGIATIFVRQAAPLPLGFAIGHGWCEPMPSARFKRVRSANFWRQSRIRLVPPRRTPRTNSMSEKSAPI